MKLIGKALILYLLVISILVVGCEKPAQPLGAYVTGTAPFSQLYYPFATGNITTSSSMYSANVGEAQGTWKVMETIKIKNPLGYVLEALEFFLIGRVISYNATSLVQYRWMISDDNVTWAPLASTSTNGTGITTVNTTSLIDTYAYQGRFYFPTTNFTGTKDYFYVKFEVAPALTSVNASGQTKNSSYIIASWRGK